MPSQALSKFSNFNILSANRNATLAIFSASHFHRTLRIFLNFQKCQSREGLLTFGTSGSCPRCLDSHSAPVWQCLLTLNSRLCRLSDFHRAAVDDFPNCDYSAHLPECSSCSSELPEVDAGHQFYYDLHAYQAKLQLSAKLLVKDCHVYFRLDRCTVRKLCSNRYYKLGVP